LIGDGNRFAAFAKPASAGEARTDKIMRKKMQHVIEIEKSQRR
jgi:hypothetical protein